MDYVDTVIANETENENLLNVAKAIKLYCIEAVAYHTSSGSSMNVGG